MLLDLTSNDRSYSMTCGSFFSLSRCIVICVYAFINPLVELINDIKRVIELHEVRKVIRLLHGTYKGGKHKINSEGISCDKFE